MENKRYKPLVDKLFFIIFIPTAFLMVGLTVFACFEPIALLIMLTMPGTMSYAVMI